MRFYSLVLTKGDGSVYQFKSTVGAFAPGVTLSSLLPQGAQTPQAGLTNPAALQVEIDASTTNYPDPDSSAAWFTVWGLGLQDIGNAANINGLNAALYAGMAKGLPLANPSQAGLLFKGQIFQAYGNWIGTEQTVQILFTAGATNNPANFPFNMTPGMPLGTAITNTLAIAMPGVPVTMNISPNLVVNHTVPAHYPSLSTFAAFVKRFSSGILGGTYEGVNIAANGEAIQVFDGTVASPASQVKAIAFQDLVGQPAWQEPGVIGFKTVMRADIHVGDTVLLPPGLVTQTAAAGGYLGQGVPQNKLTFQGKFGIRHVHHYGSSRQPSADAWVTVFQAYFIS